MFSLFVATTAFKRETDFNSFAPNKFAPLRPIFLYNLCTIVSRLSFSRISQPLCSEPRQRQAQDVNQKRGRRGQASGGKCKIVLGLVFSRLDLEVGTPLISLGSLVAELLDLVEAGIEKGYCPQDRTS